MHAGPPLRMDNEVVFVGFGDAHSGDVYRPIGPKWDVGCSAVPRLTLVPQTDEEETAASAAAAIKTSSAATHSSAALRRLGATSGSITSATSSANTNNSAGGKGALPRRAATTAGSSSRGGRWKSGSGTTGNHAAHLPNTPGRLSSSSPRGTRLFLKNKKTYCLTKAIMKIRSRLLHEIVLKLSIFVFIRNDPMILEIQESQRCVWV